MGVRDLVIVSPQVNYLVPVEVLLDANGRSLGERFAICYESSALRFVNAPPPERTRRVARGWRAILVSANAGASSVPNRPALLWASTEIADLRARLGSPLVLEGSSASEARLRALEQDGALGQTDLLHIVSHGHASDAWGSEVWLALAEYDGSTLRPSERDGLLELGDLDRWNVPTRLVVLSSCWGGGNAAMHSEGAMGLGPGLVHAGARSVINCVLPVDDAASLRFMDYFYAALFEPRARPCSIADALREARVKLRDYRAPDGSQPYRHPKFWGGFVLLGDAG
ncbi:MAG: CHAT domain-containing protein [Candidatus Eisenbacteria bacterium]|nr:CHAT domain-containing protein [Candidatus Eisenbacteria bacterium]